MTKVLLVALIALGLTPVGPAAAQTVLSLYALEDEDVPRVRLDGALSEISGLTFAPDGRLFSHQDESARVFELDPASGEVLSTFDLGPGVSGDFEGIAAVDERLFMTDSDGFLFEFRPGPDGQRIGYRVVPTGAGERCEIEGLGFDPLNLELLLPCKEPRERGLRDHLTVLAFSLRTMTLADDPRVSIPFGALEALDLDDGMHPSAIDVHRESGHLLIASARERAVLEVSPDGVPIAAKRIARRQMPQVEGLAFGPDGSLFLATEASGGRPRLARFPPSGAPPR
jgi:uncharacterized protein YjiK